MFSIFCYFLLAALCFLTICLLLTIIIGLLAHRMICCVILVPLLIIGISLLITTVVVICLYFTILATFAICIPILGPIIELMLSPLISVILCVMICFGVLIGIIFIIVAILDLADIIVTYCFTLLIFVLYSIFVTLILAVGSAVFVTEVDYVFPLLSMIESILKPLGKLPKDILNILDFKIVRDSPKIIMKLLNRLPSVGIPSVGGLPFELCNKLRNGIIPSQCSELTKFFK